jgi:putative transcriptional regulator
VELRPAGRRSRLERLRRVTQRGKSVYTQWTAMSVLAPGFLVAAPPLGDPNFDRSVVLVAAHGEEGAFGWIINGREVMSLSELLVQADVSKSPREIAGSVRVGGPVSPEQVWLVYREQHRFGDIEEQFEVGPGVVACASRRVLEAIAQGDAPAGILGLVGYAGWAPGQLENEIRVGAWLPVDLDVTLLFDEPRDTLWQRAYERAGTTPMAFTSRVGLA